MNATRSVSFARARRDTHRMLFRLLGIAAILGMAVGLYVGIHSAIASLYGTRDDFYRALHVADVEVRFVPDDAANVPDFSRIDGVASWQSRLVAPGQLALPGGERFPSEVVAATPHGDAIDGLQVVEGAAPDPSRPTEVLLDRNFAAYHHVKVGDRLELAVGKDRYPVTVRGIALSPEHLIAPANPSFFIPVKGSMAVIYAPLEMVSTRLGFPLVNSVVFRLRPGVDANDPALLDALARLAGSALTVEETIPLERHLGHLFMNVDLGAFSIFVPAVIVIFLLAALVVGFFLIYRWVEARRQTLGVFLALGYCRWRLLGAELYAVALIALAALLVAAPTAAAVLHDFAGTYSAAVGFPEPHLRFYPMIALRGVIGLIVVVLAMALWPLTSVLRLAPAAAIRGGGSRRDGQPWHTRLLQGLRHYPAVVFPVRNVVRGIRIGGTTMAAVALALGVSISYFVASDSFDGAIRRSFTGDRWNVAVDFLVPMWRDEVGAIRAMKGVRRVEEVLQGPVRLEAGGRVQPATVVGYEPGETLRHPELTAGALAPKGVAGLVLEHKLAAALGVRVGSTVQLTSENRHFTATVAGIFSGAVPGVAYAPLEAVRQWLDMPGQLTGLLLDLPDASSAALAQLRAMPRVGAVTPKSQLVDKVSEISSEAVEIIYLSAAFSIAVSIIILVASGTFTVSERKDQYTTLRTLGFADRTVGRFIVVELCLLGAIGALAATPVGYGMAAYLVSKLSAAWFHVVARLTWWDVLLPTLPLLLLLPLSALPPVRTVIRVPLAEAIKERKFG